MRKSIKYQVLSIKQKKGFTLIELLIVVAIIGILSTLLMVNFIGIRQRARDAQRKTNLSQLQTALEAYRSDIGFYPKQKSVDPLNDYPDRPPPTNDCGTAFSKNTATYMQSMPCDPLTSLPYTYTLTLQSGNGVSYTLMACLENKNDSQLSPTPTPCAGGSTWQYTVKNP